MKVRSEVRQAGHHSTQPTTRSHTRSHALVMVVHTDELSGYDPVQVRLMEEECILVDKDDKVLGHDSKKSCHLNTQIRTGKLHRAFSVFLFDTKGRLLLQERSADKITFPLTWTNTCCSHPLYIPDELVEESELGVRRAAQRKLQQELGISVEELPLDAFHCVSRIHYLAESDDTWGEHEVDYILIIQKDVTVRENPNEVASTKYVSLEELKALINDPKTRLTPWFRLMTTGTIDPKSNKQGGLLDKWWGALSHIDDMRDMNIQRFL
eukprot:Phypoly_transcript_14171.p1 GENE.Phypoly_transcript_14171~~Phypoly_transcript_14171.p1  ORF type:complete len:267 (+),score=41.72 Phypoly_transcript_14171:30-830(+)